MFPTGEDTIREGATIETVRHMRKMRGMSQQELAERAGVTQNTVSEIELGHRDPHPATLRKLAKALDVEVAEFFREAEARPKARSRPSGGWLAKAKKFIRQFDELDERDALDRSAWAHAVSEGVYLLNRSRYSGNSSLAERELTREEHEEHLVAFERISEIFGRAGDALAGEERAKEDVKGSRTA
jgi:transcriptional regulator with XRE-family HTH domain